MEIFNFNTKDVKGKIYDNGDIHTNIHSHRDVSDSSGAKVRLQAEELFEFMDKSNLIQVIGKPTRKNKILDLMFTKNSELVHHVQSKSWASFTDHNIVTITVNYFSETAEAQKQGPPL